MRKISVLFVILFASGCFNLEQKNLSHSLSDNNIAFSEGNSDSTRGHLGSVEVETVQEQALFAVRSTPTIFEVPIASEVESWERARLFFAQYLEQTPLVKLESRGGNTVTELNNHKILQSNFRYTVIKRELNNGSFRFEINCAPNNARLSQEQALFNAKNLARFILAGTLEVSMLVR